MRDHDERLVAPLAESLDDVFHASAVDEVKSVQRLVEDEEGRVFDKGPCKEYETLLARREGEEGAVGESLYSEYTHPEDALFALLRIGF